ncbi:DNA mismatch repair endonuclease MutL [Candidatus Liberibacter americanus]|uniref:DNA mismatch repair protein MutL n=1 Tax=Candidatus Liberibacter americanus str. Sao Paulo TaxID=1261131 RepID=U6B721_9HYPH|nr:DNA mismatch repair endonuclease MutL [Candidatus Liberibacter americanus]AHA27666.1 DNA mismatch repair enzyme [Candidatus Liberibacter americanus str. Sao Paulo]EMS36375.1 DNA mismatch repair protein [Candidatus Liberibacter americanus PW_SP]
MKIRKLCEKIVNQIAAGEVIERPYIAIKELIENSIDAGSTCIETSAYGGGKSFFQISDNGCGMTPEELKMAVQRHCTSKIFDDFSNIRTFGFRGEALPSIGSVAHLTLMSRSSINTIGSQITVNGDKISNINPVAMNKGTIVEVRDLFFTIPARLNFLKSEQVENNLITDLIKRMAIAHSPIRFTLSINKNTRYNIDASSFEERIYQVIGKDFLDNAIELNEISHDIALRGYAGIPTFNRSQPNQIYVFVNGRIIQDKLIFSAIRSSYAESIPQKRYPVIVLLIEIDPQQVDVNVHPAKSDVRFRNPSMVRNFIIKSIKETIFNNGIATSSVLSNKMIKSFHKSNTEKFNNYISQPKIITTENQEFRFSDENNSVIDLLDNNINNFADENNVKPIQTSHQYLGMACAQIKKNYIISQNNDELIIVDQHAAHERLVFEKMRQDFYNEKITSQILLIPEIIDLSEVECDLIIGHTDTLNRLGIAVERFGPNAIAIREIPLIIPKKDVSQLFQDIFSEIIANNTIHSLTDKIEKIIATIACYTSIRSGRKMQINEMNELLRQMEKNPNSSQCNHGRPTFIKLKLSDIEKLFGR